MTIPEATEILRNMVGEPAAEQCRGMMALADVWAEAGKDPEAEALQLLGECGKVGHERFGYGIMDTTRDANPQARVCRPWFNAADFPLGGWSKDIVEWRIRLMDAYAAADRPTRERWARETRTLAGWVACGECQGEGGTVEYRHEFGGCRTCHGAGLVPPAAEEVPA